MGRCELTLSFDLSERLRIHELCHHLTADEMFGDDAFHLLNRQLVIPGLVGPDHRRWPLLTDTKAVCFGAMNPRAGITVSEFSQSLLEIVPDFGARTVGVAFRFGRRRTQEDVPLDRVIRLHRLSLCRHEARVQSLSRDRCVYGLAVSPE